MRSSLIERTVAVCCAVALTCALMPAEGLSWAYDTAGSAAAPTENATAEHALPTAESVAAEATDEFIVVLDDASASAGSAADRLRDAAQDEGAVEARSLTEGAAATRSASASGSVTVEELSETAVLVSADSTDEAAALAQILEADAGVAYVQPNYVYELPENLAEGETGEQGSAEDAVLDGSALSARALAVNDPLWSQQSYLSGVGFDAAWETVRAEGQVSVAVLDATVLVDHEDLQGVLDLEHAWDAAQQAAYGTGKAVNHGTEVAGVLSAVCNNARGVAGASYGANLIPINVYGSQSGSLITSTATLLRAMDRLFSIVDEDPDLNVRVLNLSLGGYGQGTTNVNDRAFYDAVVRAVDDYGMVVVASGGNENSTRFSWPSDWDEVVGVASVDATLTEKADFSDYNEHKDIAAPGEEIMAPDASGSYSACEGSSFSAPIVSAAFALMFAANESLSPERAMELLYETAEDLGAPGRDDYFGWGLLDVDAAVTAACADAAYPSRSYRDVDQSAWYQTPIAYIDYAVSTGYLIGNDWRFRPTESMARAEGATVLWRMLSAEEAASYDESLTLNETTFTDVADRSWYTGAVNWAKETGVMNGYNDFVFGTDDPLSVEQVCSIFANAFAEEGAVERADLSLLDGLQDSADVSDWARANVAWCLQTGIINGYEADDGTWLRPLENVQRARFAGLVYNLDAAGLIADGR